MLLYPTGNGRLYDRLVGTIAHAVGSHRFCPVRVPEGLLPYRRDMLAPLIGNEEGNKGLVVF